MKEFFKRNVNKDFLIKKDRHKSYNHAVKSRNGTHDMVNHVKGFINEKVFTTMPIKMF